MNSQPAKTDDAPVRDRLKQASLYRMVTPEHICPFGLKSKALLERKGYHVEDYHLRSREATDVFKKKYEVDTTPQTFINGARIGGYEALKKFFGMALPDSDAKTYTPVIVIFVMALLMDVAAVWAAPGDVVSMKSIEWFVAFAMCLLAVQKLRDLRAFSNQFLGYDLLAQRFIPYAYIYPFAEALAGVLMIAGVFIWFAGPLAIFIGAAGAVSVIKAVYIDKRELKCACVGGNSNVPLGLVSLTENLMMAAMGVWMLVK